jgi:hypothetical protein
LELSQPFTWNLKVKASSFYLELGVAAEVDLWPLSLVEEGWMGHGHARHLRVLSVTVSLNK